MRQQSNQKTQKLLNGLIVLLLIIILLLIGYYFISKQSKTTTSQSSFKQTLQTLVPSSQKSFNYQTIDGKHIQIDAKTNKFIIKGFEDKLVFLKIFGWDCEFCKKEIPELIKLKRDLGDEFDVIAIEALHASVEESKLKRNTYGINYHIIAGDDYFDFYDYLKAHYAWSNTMPLTIVIGKQGNVLAFEVGAKSYSLSELMKASIIKDKESF